MIYNQPDYAAGVLFQRPGSRSAPWVTIILNPITPQALNNEYGAPAPNVMRHQDNADVLNLVVVPRLVSAVRLSRDVFRDFIEVNRFRSAT